MENSKPHPILANQPQADKEEPYRELEIAQALIRPSVIYQVTEINDPEVSIGFFFDLEAANNCANECKNAEVVSYPVYASFKQWNDEVKREKAVTTWKSLGSETQAEILNFLKEEGITL